MPKTLEYIIGFIVLILAQVFIFDHINIFGLIRPDIYIMLIMILPMEINAALLLMMGFLIGGTMDVFGAHGGLCAMTSTFLAFIRPSILILISGREVVNNGGTPSKTTMGNSRFILYITLMTFAYFTPFLFLERMSLTGFWLTILRDILSTIFTVVMIYICHHFFNRNRTSGWQQIFR